jgi:hypothetical protein
MSERSDPSHPRRIFEKRITYDEPVPLFDDDREMQNSWRMIPVQPTDDPAWFIVDSSSERKTTWGRWRDVKDGA